MVYFGAYNVRVAVTIPSSLIFRGIAAAAAVAVVLAAPGGARAQSAAGKQKPVVGSFTVSPASVAGKGGRVTLSATVSHAVSCAFSSKPAVAKLPATLNCAGGKASKVIWLPANNSVTPATYQFSLSVTGPGGTTKAKPVTAVVAAGPPAVSGLAVSPAALTAAGGPAKISGRFALSTSCSLSAQPSLAGQPFPFNCAAGETVTLPALTSSQSVTYTFTVTAIGPGGSVKSATTATVYPAMSFSAPVTIDQPTGGLDSMSCASPAFCQTIDRYGNVSSLSGSAWTPPQPVLPLPAGQAAGMTTAISCPSVTFCAAIDSGGSFATLTGSNWSASSPAGLDATALSCFSAGMCVAVGGTSAAAYIDSAWSAPVQVGTSASLSLVAVTCPDLTFCLAVSADGEAFTFNGNVWTPTAQFDGADDDVTGVSCHSASLCVAVDQSGLASIYNGASWSALKSVVGSASAGLDSVSCTKSAKYCLVSASTGVVYSYNGTSWSAATRVAGSALVAVSCTSPTACALDASSGYVWRISGSNWFSYHLEQQHGFLTSVSCPSISFCAAVDQYGSALLYNGGSWGAPEPVEPGVSLIDVSCPSTTFCMAIDAGTNPADGSDYYVYSGGVWGIGGFAFADLASLDCTSRTFCVGLTSKGNNLYAKTWNGSLWSNPELLDSQAAPLTGTLSCASKIFCMVADSAGNFSVFDGVGWSATPAAVSGATGGFAAVSCPVWGTCTAIDGAGNAFTFSNGLSWSGPVVADSAAGVTGLACLVAGFCAAVDDSGNIATDYNGTWSTTDSADTGATRPFGFTSISCPALYACAAIDYDGNLVTGTN
jgi:hypothetical protein